MTPDQYRAWLADRIERDLGDYQVSFTISTEAPPSPDRVMLERCLAHLSRLVDRNTLINAGDRNLRRDLQAYLHPPKENA